MGHQYGDSSFLSASTFPDATDTSSQWANPNDKSSLSQYSNSDHGQAELSQGTPQGQLPLVQTLPRPSAKIYWALAMCHTLF